MDIKFGKVKVKTNYMGGEFTPKRLSGFPKPDELIGLASNFEDAKIFEAFCGDEPTKPPKIADTLAVKPRIRFVALRRILGGTHFPSPLGDPFGPKIDYEALKLKEDAAQAKFLKATKLDTKKYEKSANKVFPNLPIPFPKSIVSALQGKFHFNIKIWVRYTEYRLDSNVDLDGVDAIYTVPYCYFYTVDIIKPCAENTDEPEFQSELAFFPQTRLLKLLEMEAQLEEAAVSKAIEELLKDD